MTDIYVDNLPDCCVYCSLCCSDYKGKLYCKQLDESFKENIEIVNYKERKSNCPLIPITDRLEEERKKVVGELKVDIRSLFNSYASSLIDYCIWNKNADENQKLYNNFKRIINDRLVKVLELFDKQIDQIENQGDDTNV